MVLTGEAPTCPFHDAFLREDFDCAITGKNWRFPQFRVALKWIAPFLPFLKTTLVIKNLLVTGSRQLLSSSPQSERLRTRTIDDDWNRVPRTFGRAVGKRQRVDLIQEINLVNARVLRFRQVACLKILQHAGIDKHEIAPLLQPLFQFFSRNERCGHGVI